MPMLVLAAMQLHGDATLDHLARRDVGSWAVGAVGFGPGVGGPEPLRRSTM